MMAALVYVLCATTAALCAWLLLRGYRRNRTPLLLWSGLCFALLTLDNVVLFVDRVLIPATDLSLSRAPIGLVAVGLLLHGLIWKTP